MIEEIVEIPEISSIAGERAGLRAINPDDSIDVARMFEIEQSPGMRERIAESSDDIEQDKDQLQRWIKDMNMRRSVQFYAVTADKAVNLHDHGEVEGWLRIDGTNSREGSEERNRYKRITNSTLPRNAPTPYEITYIKRPGSSPDLMTGAILQACHLIASQDAEKENRYKSVKDGRIEPRRVVMAFADQDNPKSIEVLERAGFDCLKKGVSWDEGQEPNKDMYVLDWNRYHKIMSKKESLLLQKLQTFLPDKFPVTPQIIKSQTPPPGIAIPQKNNLS